MRKLLLSAALLLGVSPLHATEKEQEITVEFKRCDTAAQTNLVTCLSTATTSSDTNMCKAIADQTTTICLTIANMVSIAAER